MSALNVLESTESVLAESKFVSIDRAKLKEMCKKWAENPFETPPWDTEVHWSSEGPELANYILLLDSLNFCFWPDKGETRWTIDYKGKTIGGYQALAASLKRAVENGLPVISADWMANATLEDVAGIFAGTGVIPLLDKRHAHINETGRVLLEKYGGKFVNAIESCQKSAVALVNLLSAEFSSFHDEPMWKGRQIRILKRAQITVTDIFGSYSGQGPASFTDINVLTAYADYKIPQVLRALGIMKYAPQLAEKVDSQTLIPAGSEEEIEIRVAMIWSVEFIRRELEALGDPRQAYELDWFLWNLGQSPLPNERPYHRTRTIFY